MRYLIFAVIAWECLWIMLFSYAILEGALRVARDKGQLESVFAFIALIVIVMPLLALGAGLLMRWLMYRRNG